MKRNNNQPVITGAQRSQLSSYPYNSSFALSLNRTVSTSSSSSSSSPHPPSILALPFPSSQNSFLIHQTKPTLKPNPFQSIQIPHPTKNHNNNYTKTLPMETSNPSDSKPDATTEAADRLSDGQDASKNDALKNKNHEDDTKEDEDNEKDRKDKDLIQGGDGDDNGDGDGNEQEARETEEECAPEVDSTLDKFFEELDHFIASESPEVPSCVEKFAKLIEVELTKYDTEESPAKLCQDSDENSALLFDAIDRISKLSDALSQHVQSESDCVHLVNLTSNVMQRAMLLLEEEFRSLLEKTLIPAPADLAEHSEKVRGDKTKQSGSFKEQEHHKKEEDRSNSSAVGRKNDTSITDNDDLFPNYSSETVFNLKRIAKTMISAGYEAECCQVYSFSRRCAYEETVCELGFEKISIDDVQKMQWQALEGQIATWIKVTKFCISIYFGAEHKLCDEVFPPAIASAMFTTMARNVIIQLLVFAEAVGMTKRSAEKLFKFLDMYETLRDLVPKIDELFTDETHELKSETISAQSRLGEAAVGIFSDLENSIKSDTGKTPVPGGAVHPLTRFTMNYVKYACEYRETLEQIFNEHKRLDRTESSDSGFDLQSLSTPAPEQNRCSQTPRSSPFAVQLMTVMDLLDKNLEAKSKLYKDMSLNYIFLMNNGRYIMQKIKGSVEIHDLMGDTWCRKRSADLRQYHKNYQRETWSKVLQVLRDEGLLVNGKVQKPVLKERFKGFNAMFEEIHKTQSSWVVSDEQLQSELRVSISAVVIPAYRSFFGRFSQYLDPGRQTEKYIKFGPEDIETYIDELFDGTPTSMARRK